MSQEATIRRGVRNARYAAIPNHVFEDMRLSMEARWLLGYLLSKPDNWTVVQKDIANKGGCGRDKARKMIAELVDAGYAEKEQARDAGRFGGMSLVIYDEPLNNPITLQTHAESVAFVPQTEMPSTAKPSTETPSTVNQALVSTDNLENTENRIEKKRTRENSEESEPQEFVSPEDDPNTAAFEKRVIRFLNGVGYDTGIWPKWDHKTTLNWIKGHFTGLTPAERAAAERWRDAYLQDAVERKVKPHPAGVFFRDRLWNALSPEILSRYETAKERATKAQEARFDGSKPDGWAAGYGPVGMARMFAYLLDGPADTELAQNQFLPRVMMAKAWPALSKFREIQQQRSGAVFPQIWHSVAEHMEAVPQGTAMLKRWKDEFKQRAWPWSAEFDRMQVVYCPRGGPDALEELQALLRGIEK